MREEIYQLNSNHLYQRNYGNKTIKRFNIVSTDIYSKSRRCWTVATEKLKVNTFEAEIISVIVNFCFQLTLIVISFLCYSKYDPYFTVPVVSVILSSMGYMSST